MQRDHSSGGHSATRLTTRPPTLAKLMHLIKELMCSMQTKQLCRPMHHALTDSEDACLALP
jgi:hypothetical protein